MPPKSKSKSADMKVRKKRWVKIISPTFRDQELGETCVFDLNNALGKPIKANLMNLLGDPRKQNIDVLFETDKLKGETAVLASIKGYKVQQPSLKKLVRRGKTKIEDSFKCHTGDKKPIIVKTFIITRNIVNKSVASKIRGFVKNLAVNKIAKMTFEDFVKGVVESRVQREVKSAAEKIYPIRIVEFSTIKIFKGAKGAFEKPSKVEEATDSKSKPAKSDKEKTTETTKDDKKEEKKSEKQEKTAEPEEAVVEEKEEKAEVKPETESEEAPAEEKKQEKADKE